MEFLSAIATSISFTNSGYNTGRWSSSDVRNFILMLVIFIGIMLCAFGGFGTKVVGGIILGLCFICAIGYYFFEKRKQKRKVVRTQAKKAL